MHKIYERSKGILKWTVLILFALALLFMVLEGFFRIYNPFRSRIKHNKIVLPVNRKYVFDNTKIRKLDRTIVHSKNAIGFRGENPPENFENFLTILAVGGSSTECFYLSDGRTWPDLLAKKLKNRYDRVWLNNAGLAGHSTFGHIILLKDYISDLKPKLALFLIGANDRSRDDINKYDRVTLEGRYSSFSNFVVKNSELAAVIANAVRVFKAQKMGVTHKDMDITKLDRLEIPDEEMKKVLNNHKGKYIDGYKKRLLELVDISRKNRIAPVFITQPMLFGDTTDDFTGIYLGELESSDSMNGALDWKVMELYNNAAEDVAGKTDTLIIDLAGRMPKDSRYFYDNWHYTNEGAEKAADIIYSELKIYIDGKYESFVRNPGEGGNKGE